MSTIQVFLYTSPQCPFSRGLLASASWKKFQREVSICDLICFEHISSWTLGVQSVPQLLISRIRYSCGDLSFAARELRVKTQNRYSAELQNRGKGLLLPDLWNIVGAYMAFCDRKTYG
jgi:hypothetical protein